MRHDCLKRKLNLRNLIRNKRVTELLRKLGLSRSAQKHRTKQRILFRSTVLVYLTLLIVSQLATPTTAYFTDTMTIEGKVTAGSTLDEKEQDEKGGEKQEKQLEEENHESGEDDEEDRAEDKMKDEADTDGQKKDDEEESVKAEKEDKSPAETETANDGGHHEDAEKKAGNQGEDADENE